MVDVSQVEALLVWCIDLPSGLTRPGGVSLPEGTRLCCSTQVWKAGEAQRFEAQLQQLRERLSYEGPHNVAAIWLERVAGTTGVLKPPRGYLEGVRALCGVRGLLMVCRRLR